MSIWTPEEVFQQEMEAYDSLPPGIRSWLANHNSNVPATRIFEMYKQFCCDEEKLWNWIKSIRILNK